MRFTVSVPSDGWLAAFLRWTLPLQVLTRACPETWYSSHLIGRFAASDWQHTEESIDALVQPGEYECW
jgi:hypothetical protein